MGDDLPRAAVVHKLLFQVNSQQI